MTAAASHPQKISSPYRIDGKFIPAKFGTVLAA